MNALDAGFYGHDGISDGHIVVVMRMEIEVDLREKRNHLADVFICHIRSQNAQCICQHDPFDRKDGDLGNEHFYIIEIRLDTVTPVFQIDVYFHVAESSILNDSSDLADVLLRGLSELRREMVKGAFAEEIDHASAGILDPGKRVAAVDKSEYLDLIEITLPFRPFRNTLQRFEITVGDTRGGDLDSVYFDFVEKDLGNTEFFAGRKRNSRGLFTIPKGGIHDFQLHMVTVSFEITVPV